MVHKCIKIHLPEIVSYFLVFGALFPKLLMIMKEFEASEELSMPDK
jgi:hypothetical protein